MIRSYYKTKIKKDKKLHSLKANASTDLSTSKKSIGSIDSIKYPLPFV